MNASTKFGRVPRLLSLFLLFIFPSLSNAQASRPPYAIAREAYSIEYLANRGAIKVVATLTVRNDGTGPLHSFPFSFPEKDIFELDTFEAADGGERISPGDARWIYEEEVLALRLEPPIQPRSSRVLSVEYVLFRYPPDNLALMMKADYFHIAGAPWRLRLTGGKG